MTKKNLSGQSLFEVVLALGLITLIMVSVVAMASLSIFNSSYAKNQTQATRLTETSLEWIRGERDNGWNDFLSQAVPNDSDQTKCFTDLSWENSKLGNCGDTDFINNTFLKREILFNFVDTTTIGVIVKVYWIDGHGYHEINSSTYLTNWN